MSRSEPLVWQGAADRKPVSYVALRVERIHKEGGGLFGIGNSPSIVGALPDAQLLEGVAIGGDGGAVTARVPGGEIPAGLQAGSRVVLGLVDAGHLICLLVPPQDVADAALPSWAAGQTCG